MGRDQGRAGVAGLERQAVEAEERTYLTVEDVSGLRDLLQWPELTTVGMCRRERTAQGAVRVEEWFFIGSRRMGVRRYAEALRNHWGIENNLHWQLDVSFHEDASRIENRHGAANFALFRKLGSALLKKHPLKDSIARKRKKAAINTEFLAEVPAGATNLEKV